MAEQKTVHLKIRRQDGPLKPRYWQEFNVPYQPGMNVITCLEEIRKNPVTAQGKPVAPVVWECSCLEEVCGACSMRINGTPQQSCSALIDNIGRALTLEPLDTFPVVRDLIVDRDVMFRNLIRVQAWVPVDGTHDLGPGPRQIAKEQSWMYVLSRCMTCGCCTDACPQVNDRHEFVGPAILSQVRLFNAHPTGKMQRHDRFEAIMGPGGIVECGNAQNCVKVCPKEIPLTQSISELGRDTLAYGIKRFFTKPDVEM
ncbi:succinate dehydrogenase iron-sulfur subunit [bacterium]|nr:succinate dehydrogenase iron-sulfur subunit [bacterium]